MVEDLHSILTSGSLHNLHLGVLRLLKTYSTQYFSSKKTFRYLGGPPGKEKRLSLVRLPLFKACTGKLACTDEKYPIPGFHVKLGRKGHTAQLNGLLTGDGLRE